MVSHQEGNVFGGERLGGVFGYCEYKVNDAIWCTGLHSYMLLSLAEQVDRPPSVVIH